MRQWRHQKNCPKTNPPCPFVSHGSSLVSELEGYKYLPALDHHSHSLARHRCGRPADFLRPKRDGNVRQNHRGDGRWRQCTDGTAILLKRVSHHCRLQQQVRSYFVSPGLAVISVHWLSLWLLVPIPRILQLFILHFILCQIFYKKRITI